MLPHRADVVIIGGGVIGASIAYHLSLEKIKAVVLEKEDIASGSSGACEGLLLLQSKMPGLHLQLAQKSTGRFPSLAEELGCDIEYENKGGLVVIESAEERAAMERFVSKEKEYGVEVSLLDRDQTREVEPALSDEIVGSTFSPLEGQVNPFLLTRSFLGAAERGGAKVFTHTEVKDIEREGNRVRAAITAKGRIETDIIVNASGAYAAEIGKMVDLNLPIQPRRGQVLVTEAVPSLVTRCLLSSKYIAAKFNPAIAKKGGVGFAVEQTANGNILIGSTREFVGFDRRTTYEGLNSIASQILRTIPKLRELQVIRAFAGLRPYTPDGLPILGSVEGVEGFIMAAGHEGDGITLSPITGEIIARLITSGTPLLSMDHLNAERFKGQS